MIAEKSRIIAEYLGWVYVPFNDLKDFPKAGWYKEIKKTLHKGEVIFANNKNYSYLCRNHSDLRFYNDLNLLFQVVAKIEKEDLRHYCYKWEDGDEQRFDFMGLEFIMFQGELEFEVHFELDPLQVISQRKLNYDTLNKDLFEVVFETISWINNVKWK